MCASSYEFGSAQVKIPRLCLTPFVVTSHKEQHPLTELGPYSVETVSRGGEVQLKMEHVASESLALANATLLKRGLPQGYCVVRDGTGREVHRF